MPISEIQEEVLRVIATNRNPDSYLAGATVVHKKPDSPRYSKVLDLLLLKQPMNMQAMKQLWLQALERARDLIASLPREEIGCLYLDADGVVVDPDPSAEAFAVLTRHRGSMRGAWPTLSS